MISRTTTIDTPCNIHAIQSINNGLIKIFFKNINIR